MPQLYPTIEEYITTTRQKATLFMVFNTAYNEVIAMGKSLQNKTPHR